MLNLLTTTLTKLVEFPDNNHNGIKTKTRRMWIY
jgi:hypothetical protein